MKKKNPNVSAIWQSINIFTHKNRSYDTSAVNVPTDSLNDHFFHYSADYFNHSWETLNLMNMSVPLPCLTSAGKDADPSVHSTYPYSMFMT